MPEITITEKAQPEQKGREPGVAQQLLTLLEETSLHVFRDTQDAVYCQWPVNGSYLVLKLNSKTFRYSLGQLLWKRHKKGLSDEAFRTVINTLAGQSLEGKKIDLNIRCASYLPEFYYDMAWQDGAHAICIGSGYWYLKAEPPLLFQRLAHQRGQEMPVEGGNIRRLLEFVNLSDEKDQLLLLVYAVSCFIPDISHPVLMVQGQAGSGKSLLCEFLKDLIDPSLLRRSRMPRYNDLVQLTAHHWALFFDNASFLSEELADHLCRASTGEGFSKRELYSDDDDIVYSYRRVVGVNGVDLGLNRSDVLDRALMLRVDRLNNGHGFRSEEELKRAWQAAKPDILGGCFDALARAMQERDNLTDIRLPRMADFGLWGCAIAKALGFQPDDFLKAYFGNIGSQHHEIVDASPTARCVVNFMAERDEWSGSSATLFAELQGIGQTLKVDKAKSFPKDARWLWRKINDVLPSLNEMGYQISREHTENGTEITIRHRIAKNNVSVVSQPEMSSSTHDDTKGDVVSRVVSQPTHEPEGCQAYADNTDDNDNNLHTLKGRLPDCPHCGANSWVKQPEPGWYYCSECHNVSVLGGEV